MGNVLAKVPEEAKAEVEAHLRAVRVPVGDVESWLTTTMGGAG